MDEEKRDAAVGDILAASAELVRLIRRRRGSPFSDDGLTARHVDALFVLARATIPVTPTALAAALDVTPSAVTQLLEPLADAGFVSKIAHPDDARSRVIVLDDAAAERVRIFEREVRGELASLFTDVSDERLQSVAETLQRAVTRR